MNNFSKRVRRYFNKTKKNFNKKEARKVFDKYYEDMYKLKTTSCNKKTIPNKYKLYSNLCEIGFMKHKERPSTYKGMTYDKQLSTEINVCYYDSKKVILASRGTVITNFKDLHMDSYVLFNTMQKNDYFKLNELLLLKIGLKYPKHRIEVTGFSLGGSISLYLLDNYKNMVSKCIVFNPGISTIPYETDILKRYANNKRATFIIKKGDMISNGIIKHKPKHLICLETKELDSKEFHPVFDLLKIHTLDNFL